MSSRRAEIRPRYGRIAAVVASLGVTVVALLGGTGVLPGPGSAPARASAYDAAATNARTTTDAVVPSAPATSAEPDAQATEPAPVDPALDETLPADSGQGRRVVFSEERQRVWLVGQAGRVRRTYLASGSLTDNLQPGTYSVYSRSEQAYGIDDSGTMKYFVRFTQGENVAIGFHDIPINDGHHVQTRAQLGTPLSHGCIRQWRPDAIALWRFAPLGTSVVVTV